MGRFPSLFEMSVQALSGLETGRNYTWPGLQSLTILARGSAEIDGESELGSFNKEVVVRIYQDPCCAESLFRIPFLECLQKVLRG